MRPHIRLRLAVATTVLGVVLMIAGIASGKNGAMVVGLCVAAASMQQVSAARRKWHS